MEEILHNLGIDWKLLIAQVINFAILFIILKVFVYKPILGILNKRKQDIEKGIEFSKSAEERLKSADLEKAETLRAAKEKALAIVTEAEGAGNVRKSEILNEAQAKRDSMVSEAKVIIDEHKHKMLEGVYASAEGLVRAGLEKVLGRMPASERDQQLIKDALKELKQYAK